MVPKWSERTGTSLDLALFLPTNILLVPPTGQDQSEVGEEAQEILLQGLPAGAQAQSKRSKSGSGEIWMHTPLSFLLNSKPMGREAQKTERPSLCSASLLISSLENQDFIPVLLPWHRCTTTVSPQGRVPLHTADS